MKKTWNIGESCLYGTVKITKVTDNSVTIALCDYKTNNKREEKTFTNRSPLFMWLTDSMSSYHADIIIKEIENAGVMLKYNSMF